jgi:hypothetical protein
VKLVPQYDIDQYGDHVEVTDGSGGFFVRADDHDELAAEMQAKLAAAYKVIRNAGINFVEDGAVDHATGTVAKETAAGGSGGVWGIDPDEADAIREAWEAA